MLTVLLVSFWHYLSSYHVFYEGSSMRSLSFSTISCQLLAAAVVGVNPSAKGVPASSTTFTFDKSVVMQAEDGQINADRSEVVEQDSFKGDKGVSLKSGLVSNVGTPASEPDLVFKVNALKAGRYVFRTHAATDAQGSETMRKARGKQNSLRLMLAVGDAHPTKRVVFVPWRPAHSCKQTTGKFSLSGQEEEIRLWLPEGVRLDYLQIIPYIPPKVPAAVKVYQPTVVPPTLRPRIWVNAESLPKIKANLTKGENASVWKKLQEQYAKPFEFKVEPNTEISYKAGLEKAAANKAFVYLMTGRAFAAILCGLQMKWRLAGLRSGR